MDGAVAVIEIEYPIDMDVNQWRILEKLVLKHNNVGWYLAVVIGQFLNCTEEGCHFELIP